MDESKESFDDTMDFNIAFSEKMVGACRDAIDVWSATHQTAKAIEEYSEVTKALARALQFNPDLENIQEEIADCFIVSLQMALMYGSKEVFDQLDLKLSRLKWNIKKKLME